jgi:hypothetical protein
VGTLVGWRCAKLWDGESDELHDRNDDDDDVLEGNLNKGEDCEMHHRGVYSLSLSLSLSLS